MSWDFSIPLTFSQLKKYGERNLHPKQALLPDVPISLSLHSRNLTGILTSCLSLSFLFLCRCWLLMLSQIDIDLVSWSLLFVEGSCGWYFEYCENDPSQTGVLLWLNSRRIRRDDKVWLEVLGEAGEGNNPRWIQHPCKQSTHDLYFLVVLGSVLVSLFLCFYRAQAFILSSVYYESLF